MSSSVMEDLMITGCLSKFARIFDLKKSESLSGAEILQRCPRIPDRNMIRFCERARSIFASEPSLLSLKSPLVIVGDLHGHFGDLIRILKTDRIPDNRYLFLGDYVDRGNFSLELVILLVLLKIKFPGNLFLIRGNHEFDCLARTGGFYSEVMRAYRSEAVYNSFMDMFSYLPLAALVDDRILCVHGGLGPVDLSLSKLANLQRPITEFDDEAIAALLWSDPRNDVDTYRKSQRGIGYFYGEQATTKYLEENRLDLLVRAHEYVTDGVRWWFDKRVVTVFSASNYCGRSNNRAGILKIDPTGITEKTYLPLEFLRKNVRSYQGLGSHTNLSVQIFNLSRFENPGVTEKPVTPRPHKHTEHRGAQVGEPCPISPAFLQAMHAARPV